MMAEPVIRKPIYASDFSKDDGLDITVLTYNILAPIFRRDIKPKARNKSFARRKRLIIKELRHYSPDVIGLQELEEKYFESDFVPALRKLGYKGFHENKSTQVVSYASSPQPAANRSFSDVGDASDFTVLTAWLLRVRLRVRVRFETSLPSRYWTAAGSSSKKINSTWSATRRFRSAHRGE